MNRPQQFTTVDLKPRKYHGYAVILFIFGTLFPPLGITHNAPTSHPTDMSPEAVAARFGIGKDFYLNVFLTVCGYIPGHVHNFYIQNIRNNKNNRRTPKWVARYGLVDTSEIERKKKRSQWATRYSERLPNSTFEGREVDEGQIPDRSSENAHEDDSTSQTRRATLWNQEEESFYGGAGSSVSLKSSASAGRWRYPANFEDTELQLGGKKKKVKKDRWARTEDAHMGVGIDDGSQKKKKKKPKKSSRKTEETSGDFINSRRSYDSSTVEDPEDPGGRQHGPPRHEPAINGSRIAGDQRNELEHEF